MGYQDEGAAQTTLTNFDHCIVVRLQANDGLVGGGHCDCCGWMDDVACGDDDDVKRGSAVLRLSQVVGARGLLAVAVAD